MFNRISFLIVVLSFFLFQSCFDEPSPTKTKKTVKLNEFGFIADSLELKKFKVKNGQTFSDLLLEQKITFPAINSILEKSEGIFDFRKITVGNDYYIFSETDTVKTIKHFVYCVNPMNYVVISLSDSIKINKIEKKIVTSEREIIGVIDRSLYATLAELNISPMLAIKLSEVFAWQIDFFRIQKGDKFKVVYEENFVDDTFIAVGEIKSAVFTHMNHDFCAFELIQNGEKDFFDLDGNSLRKAFLKAPLKFSRISSRFTNSRFHPVLRIYRPHLGIDFTAPVGTPVQSVGDGIVIFAATKGAEGKYVKVKHNGTYTSGYMHLSRFGGGITQGVRVKQGEIIGYVGSTGLSTGPHLDFRFWINGSPANYLNLEFPSTTPVSNEYRDEFESVKKEYIERFEKLDKYPDFRGIPMAFSLE